MQLNLQKGRGHGVLSVLQPKFSGVLGEALDVAARWSGDVVSPKDHHVIFSREFELHVFYLLLFWELNEVCLLTRVCYEYRKV